MTDEERLAWRKRIQGLVYNGDSGTIFEEMLSLLRERDEARARLLLAEAVVEALEGATFINSEVIQIRSAQRVHDALDAYRKEEA